MIDLAVVSVLLDAGAGPDWRYVEAATRTALHPLRGPGRGELARLHRRAVLQRPGRIRCRSTPPACAAWTPTGWPTAFQVGPSNPLVGLDGRVQLLRRLGEALAAQPEVFGTHGRPGGLFDVLVARHAGLRWRRTTSCRCC